MDNILETVQNEVQAEQSLGFHDDTEIGDMKKIEELKSDEEIDIQYASSQDSETDGSWEIPQKLTFKLQKSIPIGPERVKRPNTARTSKFVLLNKSTKLGFGYRPQNETFDEPEQPEQSDNDDSPDDSQEESDQIDAPVAKRRKISLTAVPQRRSSRVANLKMSSSMVQRGRSKSISKVDERAPKSKSKTTEKKGKTTKHRNRSRSSTRSRSKSARSKKSNKSKTAPKNKRATKRRLSHSSKK